MIRLAALAATVGLAEAGLLLAGLGIGTAGRVVFEAQRQSG